MVYMMSIVLVPRVGPEAISLKSATYLAPPLPITVVEVPINHYDRVLEGLPGKANLYSLQGLQFSGYNGGRDVSYEYHHHFVDFRNAASCAQDL